MGVDGHEAQFSGIDGGRSLQFGFGGRLWLVGGIVLTNMIGDDS